MLISLLRGNSIDFISVVVNILSSLAVIFLTMPIHEYAHGFAAVKLGDYTPKYQGRLTLNPFAHIDFLGAVCIILFGFGWAKPVQINSRNFKNPKRDMAITALAGPIANLIMSFVSLFLMSLLTYLSVVLASGLPVFFSYVCDFLYMVAYINVYLAIFNLIPIPPLDGSRLLSALLPYKYYYLLMRYERYFFYGMLLLLWTGVLSTPLNFVTSNVFTAIYNAASLIFRILL